MLKSDLINMLMAIEGDQEIAIVDHKRNLHENQGDGSSAGIYTSFDVESFPEGKNEFGEKTKPFIGLMFDNHYFPEDEDDDY